MWDDRIDENIDAAAREMTAAQLPRDLKARVLARIDEAPPGQWWSWPVVAVPAVVIVVAFVLVRVGWYTAPHDTTPATQIAASGKQPPSTRSAQNPKHTNPVSSEGSAGSAVAFVRPPTRQPAPSNQTADADLTLSPLTLEPMRVPAIAAPETIAPESIAVTPLTLTPLSSEGDK